MKEKWIATGSCICFVAIIISVLIADFKFRLPFDSNSENQYPYQPVLFSYRGNKQCNLTDMTDEYRNNPWKLQLPISQPSMQSFIQALTGTDDQVLRFTGLALCFNLKNACQPLDDVSNLNTQIHKVAIVTLMYNDETLCPLYNLAINAQNAGYSVVIFFGDSVDSLFYNIMDRAPLIPVLTTVTPSDDCSANSFTSCKELDRSYLDIRILVPDRGEALKKMKTYLCNCFYWFLVAPVITLEWMRRKRKFFCMSGTQRADEGQANDSNETVFVGEMRTMEESNGNAESHLNSDVSVEQTSENQQGINDEQQPLLNTVRGRNYAGQPRGTAIPTFRLIFHEIAQGFLYLILILAALPAGISFGGLSFFRFDYDFSFNRFECRSIFFYSVASVSSFNIWPSFQIFCFFMYSRFACKTTWNVQANWVKLIRSDWFASNIYLLVLGMVVPYCSVSNYFPYNSRFSFLAAHNTTYTICNVLFIIILNKHKFVTRYVFYISICMICAYIESDVVAVFYFAQNAEGSLNNLKLTALRTLAIGLTLTVSFSSCMHIIRKLAKPQESLFEGLSEK